MKSYRVLPALVLWLVSIVLVSSVSLINARGQSVRTLERMKYPSEPLDLVDVTFDGQTVRSLAHVTKSRNGYELSQINLSGDKDWISKITFHVKSLATKRIVAVEAELILTHPSLPQPLLLTLTPTAPMPLEPGGETNLVISDRSANVGATYLGKYGIADGPAKAQFDLGIVKYEDDTSWSKGLLLRRDPSNPTRWIPIARESSKKYNHPLLRPVSFKTNSGSVGALPAIEDTCVSYYYDFDCQILP